MEKKKQEKTLTPKSRLKDLLNVLEPKNLLRPDSKKEYIEYVKQCISTKFQKRIVILTLLALLVTILYSSAVLYLGFIQPERKQRAELESKIVSLYRDIITNEDVFISNTNNLNEFKELISIDTLPYIYIQQSLNLDIQNELQNKIGLINYRFLLYYMEQTNLLNNVINKLKIDFSEEGLKSERLIENKKFYINLMEYLTEAGWKETKFNYFIDTECLIYIMRSAFPYIKDERSDQIKCRNDSLNRIYYHFGYLEIDTPEWMKVDLKKALEERGIDAWWIDKN